MTYSAKRVPTTIGKSAHAPKSNYCQSHPSRSTSTPLQTHFSLPPCCTGPSCRLLQRTFINFSIIQLIMPWNSPSNVLRSVPVWPPVPYSTNCCCCRCHPDVGSLLVLAYKGIPRIWMGWNPPATTKPEATQQCVCLRMLLLLQQQTKTFRRNQIKELISSSWIFFCCGVLLLI